MSHQAYTLGALSLEGMEGSSSLKAKEAGARRWTEEETATLVRWCRRFPPAPSQKKVTIYGYVLSRYSLLGVVVSLETGIYTTPEQVKSHLQQVGSKAAPGSWYYNDKKFLVACGKELLPEFTDSNMQEAAEVAIPEVLGLPWVSCQWPDWQVRAKRDSTTWVSVLKPRDEAAAKGKAEPEKESTGWCVPDLAPFPLFNSGPIRVEVPSSIPSPASTPVSGLSELVEQTEIEEQRFTINDLLWVAEHWDEALAMGGLLQLRLQPSWGKAPRREEMRSRPGPYPRKNTPASDGVGSRTEGSRTEGSGAEGSPAEGSGT